MKRINDAFAFARDGRSQQGVLPIAEFERLHDSLVDMSGEVFWRLDGYLGQRGEPMLQLHVNGTIPLCCQRCLAAMPFDLDIESNLELVPEGAEMSQDELEDDTRDFLPVVRELDLLALIEDEILLALPSVPRHEKCGLPGAADAGDRINPFAALASLKGKPN